METTLEDRRLEMHNQESITPLPEGEDTRTATTGPCILLAEDDPYMRLLLTEVLRKAGYTVRACKDGWELVEELAHLAFLEGNGEIDLVVSDIRMPGYTGLQILRGFPRAKGFPPMILITAFGDVVTHARAEELGAAALLDKPFTMHQLLATVRSILDGSEVNIPWGHRGMP
jgi:DNA-binding response OmpR family regulator